MREGVGAGEKEEEREGDMLRGLSPPKPKMLATYLNRPRILIHKDKFKAIVLLRTVVFVGIMFRYRHHAADVAYNAKANSVHTAMLMINECTGTLLLWQLDQFEVELLGGSQSTHVTVKCFETLDVVGFR